MVSGTEFAAISAAVSEMFGSEATSEVFNRYGFSDQLLRDPSFQLPNAEYTRFLEACARVTGEHLFGAKIGDSVPFSELGLYGGYVTAAPTLSIALCRAARGLRYHETGSRLVCECEGSSINLRYFPATPNAVGSWHQTDGVAAMLINLIKSYEGSDWNPSAIGAWIQVSSATVELKASISSAIASAGVLHPSVFRGLPFRSQATSFSHV